jgi:WD40 repeat protein
VINKNLYNIVFCAAFVTASSFLHSSQKDQKRSASLCNVVMKSDRNSADDGVFKKYVQCIDNLQIFPTVLAELIVQYACKKISFSAEKTTFQENHPQLTSSILISPSSFATGSEDCNIKLWNYKNKMCAGNLRGYGGSVTAFAALHSGDLFVSGSRNGEITIWNPNDLQCTFPGHDEAITALAGLPSQHLVSATGGFLKIWDLSTSCCLSTLERADYDKIDGAKINPVISLILMGKKRVDEVSSKNISKIIIDDAGTFVGRIHYHQEHESAICAAVRIYGNNMLIATDKPQLKLLNSQQGGCIAHIDLSYQPTCLTYHDGTAFVGHSNGYVSVFDMLTKTCIQKFHAHFENCISYSGIEKEYKISNIIPFQDGSIIVCCTRGCMHLFNPTS